jgi:gamma-glutamyltranspeptidase
MRENGTAIDAAVATLICLGLIHPHSSGIGGGGYLLQYKRSTKTVTYLDFRETAPGASTPNMFMNRTEESGYGRCGPKGRFPLTFALLFVVNISK